MEVLAYQPGIYPRSEAVVAATRDLERGRTTEDKVGEAFAADLADFVALQREAALDFYSDGLLRWADVFRPLVDGSAGLATDGLVRWFDNNSFFRAPVVRGSPRLETPPVVNEVPDPRVATLPSPYLFAHAAERHDLMRELARDVLRPAADALVERGCRLLHLQEPWLCFRGLDDEWGAFAAAVAALTGGLSAKTVLHVYYGDAAPWIERLRELPVDAVGVDLVETDVDQLGRHWPVGLAAGCLDGRLSLLEPVDDTVALALRLVEDLEPKSLYLTSSSELELLPRDVAAAKVRVLGEASRRARAALA